MNPKEEIQLKCGELEEIFLKHGIGEGEAINFRSFDSYREMYQKNIFNASQLLESYASLCIGKTIRFSEADYIARIKQSAEGIDDAAKQLDSKIRAEIGKNCKKLVFIADYLKKFIKKLEDFAEVLKGDLKKGKNLEKIAEARYSQLANLASQMETIGKWGNRIKENILFAVKNLE